MASPYTHNYAARIEVNGLVSSKGSGAQSAVTSLLVVARRVHDNRLRKVIQMIESESLDTVQALALAVNLSSSHLQHLFKQQTGVCITHLLTEQRLRRAAHLLEASDLSVKEIAFAAGYEHASSFIRAFQRLLAQTPGDYRMQNGQQSLLNGQQSLLTE